MCLSFFSVCWGFFVRKLFKVPILTAYLKFLLEYYISLPHILRSIGAYYIMLFTTGLINLLGIHFSQNKLS